MSPKLLLRIAGGCLLFFLLGHSMGHFQRHAVTDPKARQVLQIMSENRFDMFGQLRSYDENYTGMSLNLLLTLAAFSFILFALASKVETFPSLVRIILVPIGLAVAGFALTSYLYFFPVPAVTCLLATLSIGWAALRLSNSGSKFSVPS